MVFTKVYWSIPLDMYIKTIYVFTIMSYTAMHDSLGISMGLSRESPAAELPGHKGCISSPRCRQPALRHSQLLVLLPSKSEFPAPTSTFKEYCQLLLPQSACCCNFHLLITSEIVHIFMFVGLWGYVTCGLPVYIFCPLFHYSIDCLLILRNWKSSLCILHTNPWSAICLQIEYLLDCKLVFTSQHCLLCLFLTLM